MSDTQKNFHKKLLGNVGEKQSAKFLKKIGYEILCKNFKTAIGEIDIVAKDGDTVVFCEVKTRTSDLFGLPSEAVDKLKRKKYVLVAEQYLVKKYRKIDVKCRFDVIEVENGQMFRCLLLLPRQNRQRYSCLGVLIRKARGKRFMSIL